ncbi:MAG: hypothetical protein DWH78_07640 [Planctomycetota bacterium]|nr:MAG: hypothetical protein DWH78_07640 [Planctomycetota bacterium]
MNATFCDAQFIFPIPVIVVDVAKSNVCSAMLMSKSRIRIPDETLAELVRVQKHQRSLTNPATAVSFVRGT